MHIRHVQDDETNGIFIVSNQKRDNIAHLTWVCRDSDQNVIEIRDLFIPKKEDRGQGIGSRLINLLLEHAKQLNIYEVMGETQADDELAHAFYEKHGFSFPEPHRFTITLGHNASEDKGDPQKTIENTMKKSWLHRFADWLNDWHVTRIFQAVGAFFLVFTVIGFIFDYQDRKQNRLVSAWQLITTKVPGNSGKIAALEYLNNNETLLHGIDLSIDPQSSNAGVFLKEVQLPHAKLAQANLQGADLFKANLYYADLFDANLEGAYLETANLRHADLRRARLQKANLISAELHSADLEGTNLEGTYLKDVFGVNCTNLKKAKNWQSAYRDKELACGAAIPVMPKSK